MRISDWSSDVCSSDLFDEAAVVRHAKGDRLLLVLLLQHLQDGLSLITLRLGHRCAGANEGESSAERQNLPHDEPRIRLSFQRSPFADRTAFHRRSEEHTSELQSLMRISYAVFCLK